MQDFEDILEMFEDYKRDPRPMDQEPRNMYSQGQLVSNTVDGSRPGYSGVKINMPPNRAGKFSSESIDNVSDAFLKSYADDDIQILFEKSKSNPKGLLSTTDSKAGIFGKITANENYLQTVVKNTGLDKETILNLIEDRDAFTALEKTTNSQETRFGDRKKFVTQAEKWLLNNGKRYADPVKFEKAFARTFGKNNLITKAIKANIIGSRDTGRPTINFSADFVGDIMGGAQGIDKETIKKGKAYAYSSNQLEQMFKTVIYNQNENVKNKILKTFEDIMPELGSKRTPDLRDIFNNNALLKKFGLNKSITGPIARLLAKEINEDLLNNVKNFQKPYLGTTDLVRFLKDKVDPKYKSMFEEAAKATAFAQKNNWPQAKEALNMSDAIMFDHKVPKALIDAGYADEIEYIKLNPTSAEFNKTIKRSQFDQPMIRLTNEFERTKSLDAKAKVVEKMNTLKNNFSKKYGGYLDEVSIISDKTGKPIFKSSAAPVTKQTDFVSSLGKSMVQAGEISQKQVASLLEKLGCGKSAGGRIKFNKGTTCAIKGKNKLEQILLKGAANETESSLANNILKAGKGLKNMASLKNLFGPAALAFGVATEAGFVGYDMLSSGKPFKQAVGDSLFNYMLGDKTKIDSDEVRLENYRNLGIDTDKIIEFENGIKEIKQMGKTYGDEAKAKNTLMMSDTTSNPRVSQSIKDKSRLALEEDYKEKQLAAQNLTDSLNKPETQERFDKIDFNLMPNLIESADQRVAASQVQKPSTTFFNKSMQTIFPKTNFMEDRDKTINYQPVMQEYYRGQQFNEGGLAGLMKKYYD